MYIFTMRFLVSKCAGVVSLILNEASASLISFLQHEPIIAPLTQHFTNFPLEIAAPNDKLEGARLITYSPAGSAALEAYSKASRGRQNQIYHQNIADAGLRESGSPQLPPPSVELVRDWKHSKKPRRRLTAEPSRGHNPTTYSEQNSGPSPRGKGHSENQAQPKRNLLGGTKAALTDPGGSQAKLAEKVFKLRQHEYRLAKHEESKRPQIFSAHTQGGPNAEEKFTRQNEGVFGLAIPSLKDKSINLIRKYFSVQLDGPKNAGLGAMSKGTIVTQKSSSELANRLTNIPDSTTQNLRLHLLAHSKPAAGNFMYLVRDLINDRSGTFLQPVTRETRDEWFEIGKRLNTVPKTQRDSLYKHILMEAGLDNDTHIHRRLSLFHLNLKRAARNRDVWWDKNDLKKWEAQGVDWASMSRLGDLLYFDKPNSDFELGRKYIHHRTNEIWEAMRALELHKKPLWNRVFGASPQSPPKTPAIKLLRGYLSQDGKSLYEMRLKQFTDRINSRIESFKTQHPSREEEVNKLTRIRDALLEHQTSPTNQ